jgi:gas vesicle protein
MSMAAATNTSRPQEDFSKGNTQDTLANKGGQLADKAKETAANVTDRAREVAANVADRAKDVASNVADRTKDMASSLGHKAEDATHALGSGMQALGGTVREKLPHGGVVGTAASSVANSLESGGQYLKEEGLSGMAEDVTNMIRRNPVPAMLVGVALGFIIARATARS